MTPMGLPSRNLKFAIAFFGRGIPRGWPVNDAARLSRAAGLHVPLDHVDSGDDEARRPRLTELADFAGTEEHLAHLPGAAPVLAFGYEDRIIALNLLHFYTTSGASETIFMKLRSLSSRATGPKMRVPRGLKASERTTAAFSSKRIYEPSLRRYGCAARTTTARTTSPFLTPPMGVACLTEATIMSPTVP